MIVVTDTSVILNLCLLRQERLLVSLFGSVLAPTQVVAEFQRLATVDPRFQGLEFPSFIKTVTPADTLSHLLNPTRLHAGEIAALSVAIEHQANAALMDERAGRAAAAALGLKTIGLLGILIEARHRTLLPSVAPCLDRLETEDRFWISPTLRRAILQAAGEPL
jgi:predicted nucleic acid-binding protein